MKKGMVNVLILALVLINVILTGVIIFAVVPSMNKTAKLVDKVCEIVDLNVGDKSDPSTNTGEPAITDLVGKQILFGTATETTATLAVDEDGKVHYVKLSATINLNSKSEDYDTVSEGIDKAMTTIADEILAIISNYSYEQASNGRDAIKANVTARLKQLFQTECIYSVNFSQFLVQ